MNIDKNVTAADRLNQDVSTYDVDDGLFLSQESVADIRTVLDAHATMQKALREIDNFKTTGNDYGDIIAIGNIAAAALARVEASDAKEDRSS
jgi:hypothetical protein